MDSLTRVLYWLLEASRGGSTRLKILNLIKKKPMNIRQISLKLNLDYKTVQGHIELLLENRILETPGKIYGAIYFISAEAESSNYIKKILGGFKNENKKRK